MRNPIILLLILLIISVSCAEKSTEVYPLYKMDVSIKPGENLFTMDLSLNYVSDTIEDTVIFLINKNIILDEFYGRHLIEWIPEKYPEDDRLKKLKVIFQPSLKALEYVRINSEYSAPLDQLLLPGASLDSFNLHNENGWFPIENRDRSFFYAIKLNTDDIYKIKDNGRLTDGRWQIISEKPTKQIKLSFVKNEN